MRPVAFEANGTVREARGFASSTNTSPDSVTASWTLISPTVPSAGASLRTISSTSRAVVPVRDGAGSTQAESPEWMPASSTCCMTAATYVSSPSQSASTSISIAFSTKRSTSTFPGRVGVPGFGRASAAMPATTSAPR